jgi:hypothetical protein
VPKLCDVLGFMFHETGLGEPAAQGEVLLQPDGPADGGRPPYEQIYLPAINSGRFEDVSATGSLRVLRRVK